MSWRWLLFLALLGLAVAGVVAAFEPAPGYMDADYYAAGGMQLATGHGFNEPFLWNYLDDPAGLPHPSNAYWMPLASILAAAGGLLFGPSSWFALRAGFLGVAAGIPPVTAALAYALTSRRGLAVTAGLLAVFPGYYLPLLPTSDTFGLYMLLGGIFFLILFRKPSYLNPFFLGLVAGLMHLTRADGLLWLLVAFVAAWFAIPKSADRKKAAPIYCLLLALAGYLLIMGPWLARNLSVFGTLLAPGGSRSLWLTNYDQLFSFPASGLSFSTWWGSGIRAILEARIWALGFNLANTFALQAEVFLLPLIGVGLWVFRKDRRVQLAALAWLLTLGVMTLIFPYAGARGGFIHSGAAFQTIWWALTPIGLDQLVNWVGRWRNWKVEKSGPVFQGLMVGIVAVMTAAVVYGRVIGAFNGPPAWGRENAAYRQIGGFLRDQGAPDQAVVIVANPPGFYLATGYSAIAVPNGDAAAVRMVAGRYQARYLILEKASTPAGLASLFEAPDGAAGIRYLGAVGEARVYAVQP